MRSRVPIARPACMPHHRFAGGLSHRMDQDMGQRMAGDAGESFSGRLEQRRTETLGMADHLPHLIDRIATFTDQPKSFD